MRQREMLTGNRGAALVLALLVMLVLSAMALVAMNTVATSNTMSGMHRLQSQALSVSDALNKLGMMRSGRQASEYYAEMQDHSGGLEFEDFASGSEDELGAMRRGGYVIFQSGETDRDMGQIQLQGGTDDGLLDSGEDSDDFVEAVESELQPEYAYIVRDPLLGPRAEGYGDEFCFIQVTVGSHATIGGADAPGDEIRQARALGRNASQAMIGPTECE